MDMKAFAEQLEGQVKEWQRQAADFQSQLPNIDDAMKKQYEQQIATMNENAAKAQEMLDRLKSANEAAWSDMAEGAKRSFEEWQRAVQSAMSRYKC